MPLSCYSTTDPNAVNLTHVFNDLESNGSLWRGRPSDIVGCSDTRPPGPSRCVPCSSGDNIVHVVCNMAERLKLGMEALTEAIDSFNAEPTCPTLFEPSVPGDLKEPQDRRPVDETGAQFPLWGVLLIVLGIFIIVSVSVFLYKKRRRILGFGRKFCRRANPADTKDRTMDGVSEVSPMNGVSTTIVDHA